MSRCVAKTCGNFSFGKKEFGKNPAQAKMLRGAMFNDVKSYQQNDSGARCKNGYIVRIYCNIFYYCQMSPKLLPFTVDDQLVIDVIITEVA